MSGKRKDFWDRLESSALGWTPGGRRLRIEIMGEIEKAYLNGYADGEQDGKAVGFVAGVQARRDEEDV